MPTASPLAAPSAVSALSDGDWKRLFGIHECENGNGGYSFGFGRESRQSVGSEAAFPTGTITLTGIIFNKNRCKPSAIQNKSCFIFIAEVQLGLSKTKITRENQKRFVYCLRKEPKVSGRRES